METIHISSQHKINVPPLELWTFLADTDRLNKTIGLPPVEFTPDKRVEKKGHFKAAIGAGKFKLTYDEYPFDWVRGKKYQVLREFPMGPIEKITGGIEVEEAEGGGSLLTVFAHVWPRNIFGVLIANTVLKNKAGVSVVKFAKKFEKTMNGKRRQTQGAVTTVKHPINETLFAERAKIFDRAPVQEPIRGRIKTFLRWGSDIEVTQIRAYDLADHWSMDRKAVLKGFLYASQAALTDLSWNVLCPNCRVPTDTAPDLYSFQSDTHCDTCQIRFDLDLSSSVELIFRVNQAVREARSTIFCIGGPANTPQILAQFRLGPGEVRKENVTIEPGRIRTRSYQTANIEGVEIKKTGRIPRTLEIDLEGDRVNVSAEEIKGPDVSLRVRNMTGDDALFVLERDFWRDSAATASQVTAMQEFRDLFPNVVVAPGSEVGISSIAFLFTDLKGSTSLYQKAGEAKAFEFVQDHFRLLKQAAAQFDGGFVKTMGDAVMAVFPSGFAAMRAAFLMQKWWSEFIIGRGAPGVLLKMGIHQGPCFAINNRGQLDYFGTTVNTAARVQSQSDGGDLIFTSPVWEESGVRDFMAAQGLEPEWFNTKLKGLTGEKILGRIVFIRGASKNKLRYKQDSEGYIEGNG